MMIISLRGARLKKEGSGVDSVREWDSFWRLMSRSGNTELPTSARELDQFFLEIYSNLTPLSPTILDLGAGNGALSRLLMAHRANAHLANDMDMIVLDASIDALMMNTASNDVLAVNALLEELPLRNESIDLVVSQFGVEYAKKPIWNQVFMLLKQGGSLCVAMHSKGSQIFFEYQQNDGMSSLILGSDFYLHLAQVNADSEKFSPRSLERALSELIKSGRYLSKQLVKSSMLGQLLSHYLEVCERCLMSEVEVNCVDILRWLKVAETELIAFFERIRSMIKSALSQEDFFELQDLLMELDFSIKQAGEIRLKSGEVLAFKLHAQKK